MTAPARRTHIEMMRVQRARDAVSTVRCNCVLGGTRDAADVETSDAGAQLILASVHERTFHLFVILVQRKQAHPELFHNTTRRNVLRVALRQNSDQPQLTETELDEGVSRFRRVPDALEIRVDSVTEERLLSVGVLSPQSTSADQAIRVLENYGQLVGEDRTFRRAGDAGSHKPFRVFDGVWTPDLESRKFRDSGVRMNERPVLSHIWPQQKSLGFEHTKHLAVLHNVQFSGGALPYHARRERTITRRLRRARDAP